MPGREDLAGMKCAPAGAACKLQFCDTLSLPDKKQELISNDS